MARPKVVPGIAALHSQDGPRSNSIACRIQRIHQTAPHASKMRAAGVLVLAAAARAWAPARPAPRPRAVSLKVATEDPATVADESQAPKKSSLRAAPARRGAGNHHPVPSSKRKARAPAVEGGPAPAPSPRRPGRRRAHAIDASAPTTARKSPRRAPTPSPRHAVAAARHRRETR